LTTRPFEVTERMMIHSVWSRWIGRALFVALAFVFLALPAEAAKAQPKKKAPAKIQLPKSRNGTQPKAEPKAAPAPEESKAPPPAGLSEELRGPTRIDFDDRLIQGQTNKSGAVYLFDRKETGISSMVRRRKSFKQLTLGTVYDR